MITVPFQSRHLAALQAQPEQEVEISAITPELAAALERTDSWTILDGDEALMCGGIVPYEGNGVLWTAVSLHVGRRMFAVTRICQRYLNVYQIRIETGVRVGFDAGCRWAELLGFRREAVMAGEGFGGADLYRYVRG